MKVSILKKITLALALVFSLNSCGVHVEASRTFTIGTEHLEEGSVAVYIEYAQLLIGENQHDMNQVFKASSIIEDLLFAADVRSNIMSYAVKKSLQNSMDAIASKDFYDAYRFLGYALEEFEQFSGDLYIDKESVLAYVEIILTELKLNNIDITTDMSEILDVRAQESHNFFGISIFARDQIFEGMEQISKRNYAAARENFRSAQYRLEQTN